MTIPSAQQLIGGYWGVAPSVVVEAHASHWSLRTGPAAGLLAGSPPLPWLLNKSERVSPGPDGRPTYGYPAPPITPVWIAVSLVDGPLLAYGPDFTVADDYIWFARDPFFDSTGRLEWIDGAFVEVLDVWYAVDPVPADKPLLPAGPAPAGGSDCTACGLLGKTAKLTIPDGPYAGEYESSGTFPVWSEYEGAYALIQFFDDIFIGHGYPYAVCGSNGRVVAVGYCPGGGISTGLGDFGTTACGTPTIILFPGTTFCADAGVTITTPST